MTPLYHLCSGICRRLAAPLSFPSQTCSQLLALSVPQQKEQALSFACVTTHQPAFLGSFSAWTKPMAQIINSQLLLEQHCLSFAPLYLQGTLQLQGFPLYLFSLGLLV